MGSLGSQFRRPISAEMILAGVSFKVVTYLRPYAGHTDPLGPPSLDLAYRGAKWKVKSQIFKSQSLKANA